MHDLTKQTYFAYALQMYNNPSCTGLAEFKEDLVRFKYVKRLLHRYVRTGKIRPRLLINHCIEIHNIFRPESVSRILFHRIHPSAWSALKTTLEFLNMMPDVVPSVNGTILLNKDIDRDETLRQYLDETIDGYAKTPTRICIQKSPVGR